MIKTILLSFIALVVIVVAAVLAYATTQPDDFRVQRQTTIKAPREKIFPLLTDFRSWPLWSPWEKKDPNMRRSFSGAERGHGAVYAWEGDSNVGQGQMTIVEAQPPSKVALDLHFKKPFEAHNVVDFTLEPQADGTRVTWTMRGKANFVMKVMHVFFDMDRMVGPDLEQGLVNLKATAER
jgi:uncharacterized protein YndB with AHSA1/START domain